MKLHLPIVFIVLTQFLLCVDETYGKGGHGHSGHSSHSSHSSSGHHGSSSHNTNHDSHPSGGSNPRPIGWSVPQNHHPANHESFGGNGHHQVGGAFGQQSPHHVNNPSHNNNHDHLYHPTNQFPHNPSYGYPNAPGLGYNPVVHHMDYPPTIVVHQPEKSSGPGFGQIAKEAVVHSVVDSGVKTVFNRMIPGGIYGNNHGSGTVSESAVPSDTHHTHITYNNNYGADTPVVVRHPDGHRNNPTTTQVNSSSVNGGNSTNSNGNLPPTATTVGNAGNVTAVNPRPEELKFMSPSGRAIFKHELEEFSEKLLTKDVNNAFKYITMKLQGRKTNDSITDDAPNNFLTVNATAWKIPTIKAALALEDNYELNTKTNEHVTNNERIEENDFITSIVNTEVMNMTMKFLAEKGFVKNGTYESKNSLRQIWFTQFPRGGNNSGSSGFESVFLAERDHDTIGGLHNWIYYAKKEADKQLNYLGYIKHTSLGDHGAFVKVRSRLNGTASNVTTLFVGTSPELEMSLYTLCFYISPNYPCPIKLAGNEFIIFVGRYHYIDRDILVSADTDLYIPPPSTQTPPTQTPPTQMPPIQTPPTKVKATDRKSKSGSASSIYSTTFLTKINFIALIILFKLY